MATALMIDKGSSVDGPFHSAISMALRDIDFNPARGTVHADAVRQFVAENASGATPARAYTVGKRVAMQVHATKRGTVYFETSSNGGSTWEIASGWAPRAWIASAWREGGAAFVQQDITADVAHYALVSDMGAVTHYRVRFTAFPDPGGSYAAWSGGSASARGGAALSVTTQQIT